MTPTMINLLSSLDNTPVRCKGNNKRPYLTNYIGKLNPN